MMNEKALCTARELAIGYGKTPLLSDICLGVQPGQILTQHTGLPPRAGIQGKKPQKPNTSKR